MDANDEWTGTTPEAHADAVLDILYFFAEYAALLSPLDGKPFLVGREWQKLNLAQLEQVRADVMALQQQIAARRPHQ